MSKSLKTALSRIRRSPYQAFAAISIMTTTLFLACIFSLVAIGSEVMLKFFETRPQINAYFKSDYVPTSQEVSLITSQLDATGLTEEVKYISKEEALKIYKQYNQSDPLLLEAVTAQILPASIEVSAKDPNDLKQLSEVLRTQENISDVNYAEDVVSNLTRLTRTVRIVGISLIGTLVFITFVIILLIIGIKVSSRRDEISILQLVGASSGYIASPFVWEGIIYGIVGAVFAWTAAYTLIMYLTPQLVNFFTAGIPLLPVPVLFMLELLAAETFLGMVVGGLGGYFAARRYIR